MANRFKVSGAGSWDSSNTAIWSTTDGGSAGASAPTTSDDVFATSLSGGGTLTIAAGAACKSFDSNGYTGTIAGSAALTVSDGGWRWGAGITRTYTGALTFASTSGTVWSITSNGKTFGGTIAFNGVGGKWQLGDTFSSSSTINLSNGSFDFNSKTASMTTFTSTAANVRVITLGTAQITLNGTGSVWNISATSLTLTTAAGAKLIVADASAAAKTVVAGAFTYSDLTYSGGGTLTLSSTSAVWRDVTVSSATATSFTITAGSNVIRTLDFTGFTGTWLSTQAAFSLMGSITLATGMTNSCTATITGSDTSGTTRSITSNGKSWASAFIFNGVGGVWQLGDAFVTTGAMTLTNGSFSTNAKAMQIPSLSSSNANTRTLTITNSTVTLVPTTTSTIWTLSTTTGLTFNSSGSRIKVAGTAGVTYTISPGAAITYNDLEIAGATTGVTTIATNAGSVWRDILVTNSGSGGFTVSATITCRNLDFTGSTSVTFAGASAISMTGNLTYLAATTASSTSTVTMTATSGTQTITSNGITVANSFVFDGVGGTFQLADALNTTGTTVLTNGALDTNSNSLTTLGFGSNNSNIRTINWHNSVITTTSPLGTIVNFTTSTNLTITASSGARLVASAGGASAQTMAFGSVSAPNVDVYIQGASTSTMTLSGTPSFGNMLISRTGVCVVSFTGNNMQVAALDFTGFTGTASSAINTNVSGNLTFGAAMTASMTTSGGGITLNGSGTQMITHNGVNNTSQIFMISTGTARMVDDALFSGNGGYFLQTGTFYTDSHNYTGPSMLLLGATVHLGSSSIVLNGNNVTVWEALPGTVLDAGTSNIQVTGLVSGSTTNFSAGTGLSYHYLSLSAAAPVLSGGYVISDSSAFDKIEYTGPGAQALYFNGDTTINPGGRFVCRGAAGTPWTLTGLPGSLNKTSGIMNEMDYLEVSGITAAGGALWFLGNHSDVDDTAVGWIATAAAA